MLVNLSKRACTALNLVDMKGYDYPFVKISARLETAEIPKIKTSCMFIKRGVATAGGGWSGYGYNILTHREVLNLPRILLVADRGGYWRAGNRLTISLPNQIPDAPPDPAILNHLQDVLIPILLLNGWEREAKERYMTNYRQTPSGLHINNIPPSINYKTLAPIIRRNLYEPMGLTKQVIQQRCNSALTLGESK